MGIGVDSTGKNKGLLVQALLFPKLLELIPNDIPKCRQKTSKETKGQKLLIHSIHRANKGLYGKIGELLAGLKSEAKLGKKPAPHELSATTNLIEEAGLFTKKYGRTYWLGKVKRAGVSYTEMVGMLKEIRGMDAKYSKGGRLTNLLTVRANAIKTHAKKKEV